MPIPRPPLGGLSARSFLREYWQKHPLLVRQAIPGFNGLVGRADLFRLASGDAAECRLIERSPRWRVTHGPLPRRDLSRLPARDWTLLVNGINLHSAGADALLGRFAFVPWARLDDVMVSHAADGGGVGPHVDSYDVFLLQGPGRRRWRLMPPPASGRGFRMVEGAPLKLVSGFRASEDMTLEPGDMLYLPPGWAHDGVAVGECQTYSIGFRAPGGAELSLAFLDYLHERGFGDLPYADPGRKPAQRPSRIDSHMVDHASRALGRIRWGRRDVADFLGRHLSEPKPQVVFEPPRRPQARAAFLRALAGSRVRLDARTRMLTGNACVYVNGSSIPVRGSTLASLTSLADLRQAEGAPLARGMAGDLVFDWYLQGFLHLERKP